MLKSFLNLFGNTKKAVQSKEEVIAQVERNNKEDFLKIYSFATAWLMFRTKPFTSEDLKADYYGAGNPLMREPRVVGAVFNSLYNNGLIYSEGKYQVSRNPICHGRPQKIWISTAYRLKQQTNSLAPQKDQLDIFTQSA